MIACNTLYRKPYPSVNLKFFSDRAALCPPHRHLINRTALAKKNGICYNKLIFYR